MAKKYLVLDQYREGSEYNDFMGDYYHFPKKYLKQLSSDNIEFIYYEPKSKGEGIYYGSGKIAGKPFKDKKDEDNYFVKISDYKEFDNPVPFEREDGRQWETEPYYNPQNAVRQIRENVLNEICLEGGIKLNFKADAHLIQVLGEQLIASEKVGILELIKNAYDAQASYCKVIIEKVEDLEPIDNELYSFNDYEGPVIVIEDDGTGMNREIIENGWLRPASTLKTNIKAKLKQERDKAIKEGTLGAYESLTKELKKAHKNRIPLGEKGVGRFATHRLGKFLRIKTKVADFDFEYVLDIDWSLFDKYSDQAVDLDSIGISLKKQSPSRDYGKRKSGTQIIIYGGKEGFSWDEKSIRDLNDSISKLNSPNPNPEKVKNQFEAFLNCPQLPDLEAIDYVEEFDPVFTFEGLVNDDGVLDYTLNFTPPSKKVPLGKDKWDDVKYDLKKADKEYWKKDEKLRKPKCGEFYVHLDIWYRSGPWVEGPNAIDFKRYLSNYGGVSIFRDGINIFPAEWGAEIDWLELSERQISQAFRISYYHMIGNIEIDQIDNLDLVDKTDRQGLIKNTAYNDLVKLTETIVKNIVEPQYIDKRDQYTNLTKGITRDPKKLSNYTKQTQNLIKNIGANYPVEEDPFVLLDFLGNPKDRKPKLVNLEGSVKELKKSLKLIEDTQDSLIEQAGFGLAIAVSIHEISKLTSNFYYGVNEILKKKNFDEDKLKELKNASSSLRSELKRLSPIRATRSESRMEFDVYKAVNYVKSIFKSKFEKLNIDFEVICDQEIPVYARYGAVIQVFSNILDNSCYWLDGEEIESKKIKIVFDSEYRTVTIADNGPGIHNSILPHLFKPGYSLKYPPSGLGLHICKHYMQEMKGDIYLTTNKERIGNMPGAQFTLDFYKVPKDKETAK